MNITKTLLTARVTIDHDDKDTPIYSHIQLYKEDGELIWKLNGPYGDECETLPKPKSIRQAQQDFREVYTMGSTWHPKASWLKSDT